MLEMSEMAYKIADLKLNYLLECNITEFMANLQ